MYLYKQLIQYWRIAQVIGCILLQINYVTFSRLHCANSHIIVICFYRVKPHHNRVLTLFAQVASLVVAEKWLSFPKAQKYFLTLNPIFCIILIECRPFA